MHQVGAVSHVSSAIAGLDSRRNEKPVRKDGGLIRLAVAVGVLENDDFVIGALPRLDLRIHLAASHPQTTGGVKIHLDRFGQKGIRSEQFDLETVRNLE